MRKNIDLLFEVTRNALGINQMKVAESTHIDRSAISHFESGRSSISEKKLIILAKKLHINPDFVVGKSEIPFRSKQLIKFLVRGMIPELYPLYILILYYHQLELVSLIPPMNILDKLRTLPSFRTLAALFDTRTLFGSMVYAVAARDSDNNIFLLRHRRPDEFLIWEKKDLERYVHNLITSTGKDPNRFNFTRQEISRNLYDKIKKWEKVERNDIEPLFDKIPQGEYVVLTSEEKDLINFLRQKELTPKRIKQILFLDQQEKGTR